jgi:hypothetical protein
MASKVSWRTLHEGSFSSFQGVFQDCW